MITPASTKPPRLIYLTQLFDPEPTFKGLTLIKALIRAGFEVEVVTGFPNYPGGKIYKGYRQSLIQRETMDGVAITRLPIFPSHDRSGLRRLVSYASFFISSGLYLTIAARPANVVLVFYPSLTAGMAAVLAKLFRRTPVVIDIQDMWPDSLPATGMINNRLLLGLVRTSCNLLYRLADHVIVLSEGFRQLLIQRGLPGAKSTLIYNWAEETAHEAIEPATQRLYPSDKFNVLFAGNMGPAQGLGTLLEAAALLEARAPQVLIHMVGTGVDAERLRRHTLEKGLKNVIFRPRVALSDIQQQLQAANLLLVHMTKDPLFAITIPSKTQAYLFAGKPILMAAEGEAASMIERAGAGMVCEPGNAERLADAIEKMANLDQLTLSQMGSAGRKYYDQNLAFVSGFRGTEAVLRKVMRPPEGK